MEDKIFQYTYNSIIDRDLKIGYNPLLVKHQKMLIELSENIKAGVELDLNFIELLKKICMNLINKKESDIYFNDFEYLVFLIRARSYGENIQFTVSTEKDKVEDVFNIFEDIKIVGKKHLMEHRVPMDNKDVVKISPLALTEYLKIDTSNFTEKTNYDILTTSIRGKLEGDNAITFVAQEEKEEYFDERTINDLKKIKKAYNEFPRISVTKKTQIGDTEVSTDFGDYRTNFFVI